MYKEKFGFSDEPFKPSPDPKFFFGSKTHNKAMAYLHYGLRQGEGFIVITGAVGAGKSMLISHLLDQVDSTKIVVADLITPNLQPNDLLAHILSAFRVEATQEGAGAEIEAFKEFLLDQMNRGRRAVLIVDEAQNLPRDTLEKLRVLSNLHHDGAPLFQVFLIGQPALKEIVSGDGMGQLHQSIIASYHLEALPLSEVRSYIEHRLSVVGWKEKPTITEGGYQVIHESSAGVPRNINKLMNSVLLYCSREEKKEIATGLVRKVITGLAREDVAGGVFREGGAAELSDKIKPTPPVQTAAPLKSSPLETANGSTQNDADLSGGTAPVDAGEPEQVAGEVPQKVQDPLNAAGRSAVGPDLVTGQNDDSNNASQGHMTKVEDAGVLKLLTESQDAKDTNGEEPPVGPVKERVSLNQAGDERVEGKDDQHAGPQASTFDRLRGRIKPTMPPRSTASEVREHVDQPPMRRDRSGYVNGKLNKLDAADGRSEDAVREEKNHDSINEFNAPESDFDEVSHPRRPGTPEDVAREIERVGRIDASNEQDGERDHHSNECWRTVLAQTIDDMWDDLYETHSTVSNLRRYLQQSEEKQHRSEDRIAKCLSEAEAILAELKGSSP